jgi:hypothetical protein
VAGAFDAQALLIQRLRQQRERWVDLGGGLQVQVLVLRETEMPQLRSRALVDIVVDQAIGWRGFTEAALLGAHDGASDALPFSTELWDEVARNNMDHVRAVGDVLVQHATQVMEARAAAKKP